MAQGGPTGQDSQSAQAGRGVLYCAGRGRRTERDLGDRVFAKEGGPPAVLRMDNGPEFISQALEQFCDGRFGMSSIPPGTPRNNGHIESFESRLRKECLNRNHWNTLLEPRVAIGALKDDDNHRHRHSALCYRTPAEYAAACRCTPPRWPAASTESGSHQPDSRNGWAQKRGLTILAPWHLPRIEYHYLLTSFASTPLSVERRNDWPDAKDV